MGQHQGQRPAPAGGEVEAAGDGEVEPGGRAQVGQHRGHCARTHGFVHHPQRLGFAPHLGQAQPVRVDPHGLESGGVEIAVLACAGGGLDEQGPGARSHKGAGDERQAEAQSHPAFGRDLVGPGRQAAAGEGGVDRLTAEPGHGRGRGLQPGQGVLLGLG